MPMHLKTTAAIFKFTLLEVVRTRLWIFALSVVGIMFVVAEFTASLAITESFEYRVITFATISRLVAVFIVTLFVSASVIREFDDATFELIISRPVSRANWYASKQLGYFVLAILLSIIFTLPLLYFGSHQVVIWWVSFFAELCIVAAASIAFGITLGNTTMTITAVLAFYLLSRIITALMLMSMRAAEEIAQPANILVANFMRGLAYLLPDLSRFANPNWLVNYSPAVNVDLSSDIFYVFVQTVVYCLLLSSIGLFDLYRRNL